MTASYDNIDKSESTAFNSLLQMMLSDSVPLITVNELKQIQEEVNILDTREAEEYNVSRIPGSTFIGCNKFNIDKIDHIAKDEKIVVYCSVGHRSEKIGELLQDAGYNNIKNLYGGIFAWVNQHLPIVDDHGTTDKIHPYGLFWRMWITNDDLTTNYGLHE